MSSIWDSSFTMTQLHSQCKWRQKEVPRLCASHLVTDFGLLPPHNLAPAWTTLPRSGSGSSSKMGDSAKYRLKLRNAFSTRYVVCCPEAKADQGRLFRMTHSETKSNSMTY